MRRSFLLLISIFSLAFASHLRAQNNVGSLVLDSAFHPLGAAPGKYEFDFEGAGYDGAGSEVTCYFASRFSTHLLAGGKIGTATQNTTHFGLAHYDVYGNPWPGFGTNGRADLSWSGNDYPLQLLLMPDNSILAAGACSRDTGKSVSPFQPTVYRIKANGTPDSLFHTNGRFVIWDAGAEAGELTNIDTLRVGGVQRFVAMGHTYSSLVGDSTWFYAAWFTSLGVLDSNFGTNGTTKLRGVGVYQARGYHLPDGRYLFIGRSSTDSSIVLCRLDTNGRPDSTFGVNGLLKTGVLIRTPAVSTYSKDNHLYVVGSLTDTSSHVPFALFRFSKDGVLDLAYGKNGFVSDPIFTLFVPHGITVSNDGSLLIAGETNEALSKSAAVKFFSRGIVDSSFGVNGLCKLDADFGTRRNYIIGFVPVGKLDGPPTLSHFVGIGNSFPSAFQNNFLIARYSQIPLLRQSVMTLNFGAADTGSSGSESLTITNIDSIAHLIDSASTLGSLVFAVTSPKTATTLAPGKSMTITVGYHPHDVRGDSTRMFVYDHSGLVVVVALYGVGVASGASVATQNRASSVLSLSPNPASSQIQFAIPGETIRQLTILDALGRVVRAIDMVRSPSGASAFSLDVAAMPSGVYFCTVETNAGVRSARFTVAH